VEFESTKFNMINWVHHEWKDEAWTVKTLRRYGFNKLSQRQLLKLFSYITTYGYAIMNIPQQSQHFSQQKYLLSIYRQDTDTKRESTTISLVFKESISVYNMCISLNWS